MVPDKTVSCIMIHVYRVERNVTHSCMDSYTMLKRNFNTNLYIMAVSQNFAECVLFSLSQIGY